MILFENFRWKLIEYRRLKLDIAALLMGQLLLKWPSNEIYYWYCFPRPPASGGKFPHFRRHSNFFRNPTALVKRRDLGWKIPGISGFSTFSSPSELFRNPNCTDWSAQFRSKDAWRRRICHFYCQRLTLAEKKPSGGRMSIFFASNWTFWEILTALGSRRKIDRKIPSGGGFVIFIASVWTFLEIQPALINRCDFS